MLSIHYKGTCNAAAMRALIHETTALAKEAKWKYTVIDDENYLGIILTTDIQSEPLPFIIGNENRLVNLICLNQTEKPEYAFQITTKTNFASIDNHILIAKLLKYIKLKHIPDLEVNDESDYYETENREELERKHRFLLKKLDEVSDILNYADKKGMEEVRTSRDLIALIEKLLQNNLTDDTEEKS